jgi:uncharacterized protein
MSVDPRPAWYGAPSRLLTPCWRAHGIAEITAERLNELGLIGVILDMDNTLAEWRAEAPLPEAVVWLGEIHAAGLKTCVVSNTHRTERLKRLCDILGVEYILGAVKPFRRGFRLALERMGTPADRTAVIGDQIFTDVLGGNRMGLYTVLVPPLSSAEFIGTRWISRRLERLLARMDRSEPNEP